MKRIISICVFLVAALGFSANAQVKEAPEVKNFDWNHSGLFVEIGLGAACGDINTDLGLSIGLGYRYNLGHGFLWDIAKVAYYVPTVTSDMFGDGSSMRFLSGIRYQSQPVICNRPLYGTFSAGYQMNVSDFDYWHGLAYELGVGILFSRSCSLGLVWEGDVAHFNFGPFGSQNMNFGIFGLKLGLQF